MSDPGPPTRPRTEDALGFKREEMVGWLRPRFLIKSGLEVLVSGLFGRFADKREVEAGLPADYTAVTDYDDDDELSIDYVADVGERFDPTYTVARMLGQESLGLEWDDEDYETKRGRLLILGGDQMYPSARWEDYRNRFVGPYRAALPWTPKGREPHMYAIPGNHDWYDGLTAFMRVFCQQSGWAGGAPNRGAATSL
jgi:hypothetical protein